MQSDGTDLIQITDLERDGYRPDWSPDGTAILFADRSDQLFRIAPDGSGLRQLTSGSIRYWDPTWSPDGTKIVAEGQPSGSSEGDRDIYVLDADGSHPTPITNLSDLGVAQSAM
jgi:TolB protein